MLPKTNFGSIFSKKIIKIFQIPHLIQATTGIASVIENTCHVLTADGIDVNDLERDSVEHLADLPLFAMTHI